jgi:hypothetical protein
VRQSIADGTADDADIRAAFDARRAESEQAAALLRDDAWRFDAAARTAEFDRAKQRSATARHWRWPSR